MTLRPDLWKSTCDAHKVIQNSVFCLQDIAARVDYLHPRLAEDLMALAKKIETARKTIQGDAAEEVNQQLQDSQRATGEILLALLERPQS